MPHPPLAMTPLMIMYDNLWVFVDPINTFHSTYKTDNEPIRLSYHGNVHYNSVVDPRKATIGVGLGLPGLQPGVRSAGCMLAIRT